MVYSKKRQILQIQTLVVCGYYVTSLTTDTVAVSLCEYHTTLISINMWVSHEIMLSSHFAPAAKANGRCAYWQSTFRSGSFHLSQKRNKTSNDCAHVAESALVDVDVLALEQRMK